MNNNLIFLAFYIPLLLATLFMPVIVHFAMKALRTISNPAKLWLEMNNRIIAWLDKDEASREERKILRGRKRIPGERPDPTTLPILQPIYGGRWAAHGDGWAVHGATKEEALENYRKAEQRHRELLALPPWYLNPDNPANQRKEQP